MRHRRPTAVLIPVVLLALGAPFRPGAVPLAGQDAGDDMVQGVPEAVRHIQAQEFERAVEILEEVTAREPENARAWSLLGVSLHSLGALDRAIAAHTRAAEFDQTRPTALFNLGLTYALKGDPDRAFRSLQEAEATGRVDMTRLDLDPDAESLRNDPRYAALLPSEAELADPFVEEVEVLHEWRGEHAGDQFGWIARDAGDVDGDGIHDVTTSAPTWGENAGKVYLFSGRTGETLWTREGEPEWQLGLGIESAGDVNADGVPDVVAGAPFGDRALVFHGRTGEVLLEIEAPQPGEFFARKAGDAGDVDGDGHDDLLLGGSRNDEAGEDTGRMYLFSGRDGSLLHAWTGEEPGDQFGAAGAGTTWARGGLYAIGAPNAGPSDRGRVYVYDGLTDEPAFVIEADESGAFLGQMFVSIVGDVDGDGVPDVYGSDWADGALGRTTGRIYVHSGADGRRLLALGGEAAGDGFGIGTADAGDLDGDGHDDLVVGAWQQGSVAPSGGKVYVYSGRDGTLLFSITGKVPGETFGFDATGVGDVDGDGTPDLLLTSAWSSVHGARTGRMFVVSGRAPRPR
ncbi:MAG: FG-GAP-like repeat-containing protein [Gemmatimonadota bacterium]|jgi:hypothetical protein